MTQVTLEIPDEVCDQARREAARADRPLEEYLAQQWIGRFTSADEDALSDHREPKLTNVDQAGEAC